MKIFFFVLISVSFAFAQNPLQKVSLQMDWKYQFEQAGFIAAKERGFYKEAGLDVEFREYQDGLDVVSDVLSQKTTYGIFNSSIIIENGHVMPIVLLGTYLQRSPLIFVAQKGIKNPADMVGKTIMGTKNELKSSSLALLLNHFDISPKNAKFRDHTYGVNEFIDGKVDVMTAFRSNELFFLDKAGKQYEIIDPAEYGFVMSAINLFTSRNEALNHPERTRKFIEATNKGWKYALDHQDEMIEILLRHYHSAKSREALLYEAKVIKSMMMTDFYTIGEVNAELTSRTFKQLVQAGTLTPDQRLGRFMFKDVVEATHDGITLSTAEKEYLLRKKRITMCVDPEWYPFEAIREGKHIGIAADVMKNFEHILGVPLTMVPTTSWDESVQYAKMRKCDIYSLASSTPERRTYMEFTAPYISLPIVMATTMDKPFTEDITTLTDKRLGAVKGYAITEKLKSQYPYLHVVEVESITDGLSRVEKGDLYGYIDNLMTTSSYIQKEYTGILKVSSRLDDKVDLAVGTRNDEPQLHAIFEKLVQGNEPTMQEIYNRWVSTVEEVPWINRPMALKATLALLIVMTAFMWRYYILKRYNTRLFELSRTDKLTALFNRLTIDQKLAEEQKKVNRYERYSCSVMLIDVDLFKGVNDTYGHQTGDDVLRKLADILKKSVRETDVVGRWGGEEFIIILPHTEEKQGMAVAEHLRKKVEEYPFDLAVPVTISVGVGMYQPTDTVHECISRIDTALYEAKNSGRNRVCRA